MSTTQEIQFKAYNTRRNLPDGVGQRRGEANFLGAFVRAVLPKVSLPCIYGRNFPVPGCGVADLLLCEIPESIEESFALGEMSLLAFEMKLSDWRKALHQAYRYKYYADFSVVVLPEKAANRAVEARSIFEGLGVGLWTFDASTGIIHKHVDVAGCQTPLSATKRDQALSRLRPRLTNFCKSHKKE